jgi:hypothetical protein
MVLLVDSLRPRAVCATTNSPCVNTGWVAKNADDRVQLPE